MILPTKPENFNPVDVVGCFIEYAGKFLVLLRQDYKAQGNTWGLPSGKVEKGESIQEALVREIVQETGYNAEVEDLKFFKTLFVKHNSDINYHIFSLALSSKPEITISDQEHKEYRWVTPEESLALNYIEDLDFCIKMFYNL